MSMKDFFLAGLAVEEAKEQRDVARAKLREAAAKACPNELAALERSSDALNESERAFAQAVNALMQGRTEGAMRQWMVDHAAMCDNPQCEIRRALEKSNEAKKQAN